MDYNKLNPQKDKDIFQGQCLSQKMSAVSPELRQTILELQQLPSISKFSLGGGTNLALRYSHRVSIDIDFISPEIITKKRL